MRRTLFTTTMLVAAAAAFSAPAVAQSSDDGSSDTERLEEIVITTPGPSRAADELIGLASVLDRDEILDELAGTLGDTLAGEPGVASTFFGQGASRPLLRGLGAERVQVLTNGIGVIDVSAASPDHQVTADGIDAERIEILRGPAALAYGGQAIGGVVNVIDGLIVEELADRPLSFDGLAAYNDVNEGSEFAGRVKAEAGPLVFTLTGSLRDFGDYDIPGFGESDILRAMEEAEEEEHDEEEHGDEDHGDEEEARDTLPNSFYESQTLAGGVSWVGDDAFFGVAVRQQTAEYGLPGGHEHEHGEEEGEGLEAELEGEGEEEEGEENPFIDLEQTRVDVRGGFALNAGVFTDVVGTLAFADYEHTEFEAPGEVGTVYANEGVEGRLEVGTAFAGFEGAWGLQFTDLEFSAIGAEAFVTPTDTTSYAIFAYETREFESGFGLEGGLRFENVERDNINLGERSFDLISGSAGVNQRFANGFFLGAQASYTERAPNESELFSDGPHLATNQFEIGDPEFDKETGINLEGTARWSNDDVSVGANLYFNEFTEFVFLSPRGDVEDGLPVFVYLQDDVTFVGGEIYGAVQVADVLAGDWTFNASLDWVSGEIDEGGDVPLLPPMTLKAGAYGQWGPLGLGVDVVVADEQDEPGDDRLPTDGYTLVDLRGDWAVSGWGRERPVLLFIEARNIGDEEARLSTSVLKDVAPLPGRNIRAGVRVSF